MKQNQLMLVAALAIGMAAGSATGRSQGTGATPRVEPVTVSPVVTFVELGSVKCIPCRQMQPVMKAIEEKYGGQVKVVFHDVWTEKGSAQAEPYRIRLIPTQIFLDAKGKEFFRHEGFFPEAEIDRILKKRGLRIPE